MLITMLKTKRLEMSFQHPRARPRIFQHFQHKKVSGSLYGREFSTISTRKFSTISTLLTIVDKMLKTKKLPKLRYLIMFFVWNAKQIWKKCKNSITFKYENSPQNLHIWPKILAHRGDKNNPQMKIFSVSSQSTQKNSEPPARICGLTMEMRFLHDSSTFIY